MISLADLNLCFLKIVFCELSVTHDNKICHGWRKYMKTLAAFEINVLIYFIIPFFVCSIYNRSRVDALYNYLATVLLWGGFAGAIYSFKLSDAITISGGNIAYGAFMMTAVLLILTERSRMTFFKIIRILIGVDAVVFIGFCFMTAIFKMGLAVNPLGVPPELFHTSFWILVFGGILILCEILTLYFVFLHLGTRINDITLLSVLYVLAFAVMLILDGILFPILVFGVHQDLEHTIIGDLPGKLTLAVSFAVPLLIYLIINRNDVKNFKDANIKLRDVVNYRFELLIHRMHAYEVNSELQQRKIKQLIDISGTDTLTGIANRRKFEETLNTEWFRAQRTKSPITLIVGDVDHFKYYNDTYGHPQGDVCLKQIATLWHELAKRTSDVAARIGGEEFALIIPDTEASTLVGSLEQFMKDLEKAAIAHKSSPIAPFITMSIGVASCIPSSDKTPLELYKLADQRLYEAKNRGRNRIVYE